MNSSVKMSPLAADATTLQVAGAYQLFEYKNIDGERKLIALPITVQVSQQVDLLTVELFNESDRTTTVLKYPMNGAASWNEGRKAFVYTRANSETIIADVIYPAASEDRSARATFRITWRKDETGSILETFEDFDADGNRLESSPGHLRTLIPIAQA